MVMLTLLLIQMLLLQLQMYGLDAGNVSFSKQKDAAWYFIQWASSGDHGMFGRRMDFREPCASIRLDDSEFRSRINESYPGYLNQHDLSAPGAKIYFTAQPCSLTFCTMGRDSPKDGRQICPSR